MLIMDNSENRDYYISKIVGRKIKNDKAELRLENQKILKLRRFVPVGERDTIEFIKKGYWARLPNNEKVRITPSWRWTTKLKSIPNFKIIIKEIDTKSELEGYEKLTQFHYRGNGGVGRRVPLIVKNTRWELPNVIGFIEISSSFLVNTARNKILNATFSDPERNIAWSKWTHQVQKKFGNAIARISRCVVYPELRGLGLSTVITEAAIKYTKERWHIGGLRPIFIEITAEMLRYWPFVEKCGFYYIGETEGNKHRAVEDMKYLVRKAMRASALPQGGGGIMSLQRSHATLLTEVMNNSKLSLNQILTYLRQSPEKLTDDEWVALHKVYRRPKPTYMVGLTEASQNFLKRRYRLGGIKKNLFPRNKKPQNPIFTIKGLSIEITSLPNSTGRARRVQEAFGIVSKQFSSSVVTNLDIELKTGEIVLISGPSGAGKSILLRAIRWLIGSGRKRGWLPEGFNVDCSEKTERVDVAWNRDVPLDKSPIELFDEYSIDESVRILALAGLAEAQLFVRQTKTLSLGQYYRLSLACAMARKADILLIDEFCEPLDQYTTVAVCRRLKKAANDLGMGIIVATAYPSKVVNFLNADKTLRLSSNGQNKWDESITDVVE